MVLFSRFYYLVVFRDCLTSFRPFFFIKKNKAFLLKISLKAFLVSD